MDTLLLEFIEDSQDSLNIMQDENSSSGRGPSPDDSQTGKRLKAYCNYPKYVLGLEPPEFTIGNCILTYVNNFQFQTMCLKRYKLHDPDWLVLLSEIQLLKLSVYCTTCILRECSDFTQKCCQQINMAMGN